MTGNPAERLVNHYICPGRDSLHDRKISGLFLLTTSLSEMKIKWNVHTWIHTCCYNINLVTQYCMNLPWFYIMWQIVGIPIIQACLSITPHPLSTVHTPYSISPPLPLFTPTTTSPLPLPLPSQQRDRRASQVTAHRLEARRLESSALQRQPSPRHPPNPVRKITLLFTFHLHKLILSFCFK